jgi:formate hydrogenlyase subunit 3/multisubunit Na+/H+ antiporter MnhD subunit
MSIDNFYPLFRLDSLSGFILVSIAIFGGLITLYSLKFMKGKPGQGPYYTYIILTVIISMLVVLANHLILLLVLWGFLAFTLYALINISTQKQAHPTAKKAFLIVAGSDCLMILGIGIMYQLTHTFQMDKINLPLAGSPVNLLANLAFICLAIACFAKAGAMPMHSWIPDTSQYAPVPVTALLPASLDKLLGIYLLMRICTDLFVMNKAMMVFLMTIGAFTILAAVMMALIQRDLKRLLGYHAVSQVGYMVLGIGTATPIGIAGGLFHMLNNAIYKSCLFLIGGNVEYRTKTTELDSLGGLGKFMPLTFIACLVASFSISGLPPFNGFVSKWMVYQGLIDLGSKSQGVGFRLFSFLCLMSAMFGSGLTLASFLKLIHATFLGQRPTEPIGQWPKEVPWTMWLPMIILASVCIIFGVFHLRVPLKHLILPAAVSGVIFKGFWDSSLATLLIFVGVILGVVIYWLSSPGKIGNEREDATYIGGENISPEVARVSGVDFYNTVKNTKYIRAIYKKAQEGFFDIYEQVRKGTFAFDRVLRQLHSGILPTYFFWALLGLVLLLLFLFVY